VPSAGLRRGQITQIQADLHRQVRGIFAHENRNLDALGSLGTGLDATVLRLWI